MAERSASSLRHPMDAKKEGLYCKTCESRSSFWAPQIKKPLEWMIANKKQIADTEGNTGGLVQTHLFGVGKAPSRFVLRHDEHEVVVIEESPENIAFELEEMGEDPE